jgi:hypothetical protein
MIISPILSDEKILDFLKNKMHKFIIPKANNTFHNAEFQNSKFISEIKLNKTVMNNEQILEKDAK